MKCNLQTKCKLMKMLRLSARDIGGFPPIGGPPRKMPLLIPTSFQMSEFAGSVILIGFFTVDPTKRLINQRYVPVYSCPERV